MNNKDSFYASLESALFNFIKSKYLIEREDFSKDRLKSILEKDKISDNIIEDLIDIINSCELATENSSALFCILLAFVVSYVYG